MVDKNNYDNGSSLFDKLKLKASSIFKKKEMYSREQEGLPNTAQDMYGDVPEQLPDEQQETPRNLPPDDLPEVDFPEEKFEPPVQPEEKRKILPDGSMGEQMEIFESTVSTMYPENEREVIQESVEEVSEEKTSTEMDHGFFNEFQRFLDSNNLPSVAETVVGKDLLEKMKEYHTHRDEGKAYYFHAEDMKVALKRLMVELRSMETSWFVHKQKIADEERKLINAEENINDKVEELKSLLNQIKTRDEFLLEAPDKSFFYLINGQAVKSLSDLVAALRVMDDEVFKHHVNKARNDFSAWIKVVFKDKPLAKKILKAKNKKEMLKILLNAEGVSE